MIEVNHEYYVSLEVANLLKKAGFNWYGKYSYIIAPVGDMPTGEEGMLIESNSDVNWLVKAPTLDVAQRWLRGTWDLIITIEYNYHNNAFICKVYSKAECLSVLFDFSVYEEAQEAGIKKALEIILEKDVN